MKILAIWTLCFAVGVCLANAKSSDTKDVLKEAKYLVKSLEILKGRIDDAAQELEREKNLQTDEEGLTGSRQRAADIVVKDGVELTNKLPLTTNPDEDTIEVKIQEMQARLQATGAATTSNLLRGAAEVMANLGIPAPEALDVINKDTRKVEGTIKGMNMEERTAFSFDRFTTWERGIVPYVFDEANPESAEGRANILAAMQYMESVSCLQFPAWTENTQQEYGLSHNARISFIASSGSCWSYLGRITADGAQPVAACSSTGVAIHEILHALAGRHEQSRSDRDQWIQIIWSNIDEGNQHNFQKDETLNIVPYDYSSVMQYSIGSFAVDRTKQSMEVYDTDLEFLVGSRESLMSHSDIAAINIGFNCIAQECSTFSLQCSNYGFFAYIDHKCQCVCPGGLGGPTCEEISSPESPSLWPQGSYTIPQTNGGCPSGMTSGTRFQTQKASFWVKWNGNPHWPSGSYERNTFNHHFCTSQGSASGPAGSYDWPAGTYCIYRKNGVCPTGFENGRILYDDDNSGSNQNTQTGVVPDGQFGEDTTFEFCCRNDGSVSMPIKLPRCSAFFLLNGATSSQCQKVEGMSVSSESYMMLTEENNEFVAPHPYFSQYIYDNYNMVINTYCYYRPKQYNCGYIVTLDQYSPTWTLKYPKSGNYSSDKVCQWLIKSPINTIMKLEFSGFNIAANEDGSCVDYLEIKHHSITVPGARYCGDRFVRSMTTNDNYLMLVFESSETSAGYGFTAQISLVDSSRLVYDLATRGLNYQGNVNYDQHYRRCLRWDEVPKCPINSTSDQTGTLGAHNYCRNPNGAEQPWCYISENCDTDYCDVSGINNCYDLAKDCASKFSDPNYCQSEEAFSSCHLTCDFCGEGITEGI